MNSPKEKDSQFLIIDPYIKEPAIHCSNQLIKLIGKSCSLYYPSVYPMKELSEQKYSGIFVLGSASHVSQRLSWHQDLARFLDKKLKESTPVLGLCFGHQLMADFYGCKVDFFKTPEDRLWRKRPIKFQKDWGSIKKDSQWEVAVTHRQAVLELSESFEVLASGPQDFLKYDLIQHKTLPFVGSQAHLEASPYFCTHSAELETNEQHQVIKNGTYLIKNFIEQFIK